MPYLLLLIAMMILMAAPFYAINMSNRIAAEVSRNLLSFEIENICRHMLFWGITIGLIAGFAFHLIFRR